MMNEIKNSYPNGKCPCGETVPHNVENGDECANCGHVFGEENSEPDDSMDGDHQSGLASAGFGTDEDYEHNLFDE